MVRQYSQIKESCPDAILMFRLGDFYEMFYNDAVIASNILNITLTSRNKNDANPMPLCGVPYHSVEPYISKLLESGRKVAICDQVEDPKLAKGVVRREVTRILTPGVNAEGLGLSSSQANYLAAVCLHDGLYGLAVVEASTGYFSASEYSGRAELVSELARVAPREVLLARGRKGSRLEARDLSEAVGGALVSELDESEFDSAGLRDIEGGDAVAAEMPAAARAAGGALAYLTAAQMGRPAQVVRIEFGGGSTMMRLDEQTKRNLELVSTMREGSREGSLLWALDCTKTAAGARLLGRWLLYPLTNCGLIEARQDSVEAFVEGAELRDAVSSALAEIYDVERITSRAATARANARDLAALAQSLAAISKLKGILGPLEAPLSELASRIDPMEGLRERLAATIVGEPPLSVRDGGIVRPGVSEELDELRDAVSGGKRRIAAMESAEREATGIGSLKIRYNKVFGYYLEVTNAHRNKVPDRYIRKQTLANAERYITPELKEYEQRVLGGEGRAKAMEYEIFSELRREVACAVARLQRSAQAAAEIDCLLSLARVAVEHDYARPKVEDTPALEIADGRHPIVERLIEERFVPNDVTMDGDGRRMIMVTGPNMAGKSTVMRQTALIALMAQIGSFVPAKEARIGVVDRIFTRVGASDALARGQSTFMVEMAEASVILREAGPRSLVLIDEIGRGTSTFDGLAIAWAVAEDLHDRVRARTMFATHYHELTELARTKDGIANFQVAVKEWEGSIVFLRKLTEGATPHSYGIHVAHLAGLPDGVIRRADEVLSNLEDGEYDEIGSPRIAIARGGTARDDAQYGLFAEEAPSEVVRALSDLDADSITPLQALNIIHELKGKV